VGENVLNHQYFHRRLFDFSQIWYKVDHVTSDLLQKFKVKCQGQGHSVKTSFNRQITAPFEELGVAIGNVGSAEILCACSVQNWPKTAENDWRDIVRFSDCNAFATATFSIVCLRSIVS